MPGGHLGRGRDYLYDSIAVLAPMPHFSQQLGGEGQPLYGLRKERP